MSVKKSKGLPVVASSWYKEGLRFECTGCGRCCTGQPGYVWLSEEEIGTIADHLGISVETFMRRYVRKTVTGCYSLLDVLPSYDCVFFRDNRCTIYPVRPTQCRTFPWWPENLKSKHAWKETARHCEGIAETAPLRTLEEIQKELDEQNAYLLLLGSEAYHRGEN